MRKSSWALGLAFSLAAVTVAFTETRDAADVETKAAQSSESQSSRCVVREVALDEGYGVTRTEKRLVCSDR